MNIDFFSLTESVIHEHSLLQEANQNVLIDIGLKAKKARQLHTAAVENKNTDMQIKQRNQLLSLRQSLKNELSNFPIGSKRTEPYTDEEVNTFIKAKYDDRIFSSLIFLHSDMIKDLA